MRIRSSRQPIPANLGMIGNMTRTVAGARVLITGAAMGMGRLYAERAVAEGAKAVILWDRDSAALSATVAELNDLAWPGTRIAPYVVDISDLGAIAQTAQTRTSNCPTRSSRQRKTSARSAPR